VEQTDDLEYVGFWLRLVAAIIDTVLIWIITWPILWHIYGASFWSFDVPVIVGPADFFLTWVAPAVATVLFWVYRQATPGKMAISARIVDAATGKNPSVAQFIGRYVGYFFAAIPVGIGIVWIGIDRRKQGWHDKWARTVVVRSKNRGPWPVRSNG
jgi:uncharacterized RDD family membrane protein YckC